MIKRQQVLNGCQTTILRNKHMTTTSCYHFTLYLPVEESPNTHFQSHSISVIILPSSPHRGWPVEEAARGMVRGVEEAGGGRVEEVVVVVVVEEDIARVCKEVFEMGTGT